MPKNKFWQFRNARDKEKTGELLLYGYIESTTWWGDEITPKNFKKDLDALGEIDILNLYINSGGGDLFAAQAIYSMLKRHAAKKNVYIDGLAASAASVVAMVGDTVYMPKNAMMMVHNPAIFAYGNSTDFRKLAEDLDNIRTTMIAVYSEKTDLEDTKVIELLDAETWMTADEALEYGFIDEIDAEKEVAASLKDGFLVLNGQQTDLSRYKNPPKLAFLPEEKPPEPPKKEEKQAENRLLLYENTIKINENWRLKT